MKQLVANCHRQSPEAGAIRPVLRRGPSGGPTWLLPTLLSMLLVSSVQAQGGIDRVRRRTGVDSGKITNVFALGVTVTRGGVDTKVPSEEIVSIAFAGEPQEMTALRNNVQAGQFEEALAIAQKLDPAKIQRQEILADLEFYAALAQARRAIATRSELTAARKQVLEFLGRQGDSYHVPEAIELLGDVLLAEGQFANARSQYAKLAKAKSNYYLMQSKLLSARAWQAEGKHPEALAELQAIADAKSTGGQLAAIVQAAQLVGAISRAATGQLEQATQEVGQMIERADPEEGELLADAYNALGDCYLQAGDRQGALFAFLHVDLLYSDQRDAHAKALTELVPLWRELGHDDRADEAQAQLASRYPNRAPEGSP
jgi:tetratricopeptide (TPR) repeat protein